MPNHIDPSARARLIADPARGLRQRLDIAIALAALVLAILVAALLRSI